jgi:hypothetical protein
MRSTRLTMLSSTADAWHLSGTLAASARRARESEPQAARKDRGAATPARGRSRCAMRAAAGKRTSKRGSKYIRKRKKKGQKICLLLRWHLGSCDERELSTSLPAPDGAAFRAAAQSREQGAAKTGTYLRPGT